MLKVIGGVNGKCDGRKILEPVVYSLIAPSFMCKISWTGRAGKGEPRKIPLSKYINVVNLIAFTLNKADRRYTQLKTENKLKYTIIKNVNAKFGDLSPISSVSR